jgi:hypothetical protein
VNRTNRRDVIGIVAVGLLLAANAVVPLVWGDIYPFSSAPMFRDAPTRYANYRVYDPQGNELPSRHYALDKDKTADPFLVGRVYDGNPVGYGVGIARRRCWSRSSASCTTRRPCGGISRRAHPAGECEVSVRRRRAGGDRAIDGQRVGIIETKKWRIDRAPASRDKPPRHEDTK